MEIKSNLSEQLFFQLPLLLKGTSRGLAVAAKPSFCGMITINQSMRKIFDYVSAVACSPNPILITGETGVGKELMSRAIHMQSGVRGRFVALNVAEPDDTLFSDTLFGHEKGAFTGADRSREGLIKKAAGGTLFLDEIGELQPASQVKLLRLIQEHEYYPLGSDAPLKSSARIVLTTNRDFQREMKAGRFRSDLYFRLISHQVELPPLRKRPEDVPLLVDHFVTETSLELNRPKLAIPPELFTLLGTYHFPGNIRELRSMVHDAIHQNPSGTLSLKSFREHMKKMRQSQEKTPCQHSGDDGSLSLSFNSFPTQREIIRLLTREALKRADGNKRLAASMLGITRQALIKRLKAY